MKELEAYRHVVPIQIRFSDIDRLDHVNNSCYHNYCELGRVKYFEEVLAGQINWDHQGFILARTEIDHIEPLFLHDEVRCYSRIEHIGNKSITFRNIITKGNKGEELISAAIKGILVAMDYKKNESIIVPDPWRRMIESYETLQKK